MGRNVLCRLVVSLACLSLLVTAQDACPSAPGAERAACFCKTVGTAYRYYADTGNRCSGAAWCYGPGQSTYISCQQGLLFSDKLQVCDWAANVVCAAAPAPTPASNPSPSPRAASPSPRPRAAIPSPSPLVAPPAPPSGSSSCISGGYTQPGGACGASNGLCCPSGCCSKYGYCGTTDAHCGSGCQAGYGSCSNTGGTVSPPSTPPPTVPGPSTASPPSSPPGSVTTNRAVTDYISSSLFKQIFLRRNDPACSSNGFYTYSAFVAAAAAFPGFGTARDAATNKRELAAFLAQISQETTGAPTNGPYTWGLCWIQEGGKTPSEQPYCESAEYPCAPGKKCFGRGPMQLSWNYNYIPAGRDLGFDGLNNPDAVAQDAVLSFKTAIWFWMTPSSPKPSCHEVMAGIWTPSPADVAAGRLPGFGLTTNIINGGLECKGFVADRERGRIGYFERYAGLFGVSTGDNLDCSRQQNYG